MRFRMIDEGPGAFLDRIRQADLGDTLQRYNGLAPLANASGGGSSGSSTTKTEPWDKQKPYLETGFSDAQNLYNGGYLAPAYYPGQTVAGMSGNTADAIAAQAERARVGSPVDDAAQSQVAATAGGAYLNGNPVNGLAGSIAQNGGNSAGLDAYQNNQGGSALAQYAQGLNSGLLSQFANGSENPYLDQTYDQAANKVRASMDSNFSKAGRYGSGAQAAAEGDALNNLATSIYGGAYENDANRRLSAAQNLSSLQLQGLQGASSADLARAAGLTTAGQNQTADRLQAASLLGNAYSDERNNQLKASALAPSLAAEDYKDTAALSEAGAAQESYTQDQLNDLLTRYNYEAARPQTALQAYMGLIQGNYGGTSSTTQKASSGNRLGGTLGGAASGAAAGSTFGPWGTAIGAGVGGLMGAFS